MGILNFLPMQVWVWLGIAVVMLIIEAISVGLTSIWMGAGAFAAAVVALVTDNVIIQILVFAVVSLILLIATRPLAKRMLNSKTEKTNAEALIGEKAVVLSEITPLQYGEVKIGGQVWTAALTPGAEVIHKDEVVKVFGIEGVKLIVGKEN